MNRGYASLSPWARTGVVLERHSPSGLLDEASIHEEIYGKFDVPG